MKLNQIVETDFENSPFKSRAHRIHAENQKLAAIQKEIGYYVKHGADLQQNIKTKLMSQGISFTWGADTKSIKQAIQNGVIIVSPEIAEYNKKIGKVITRIRKLKANELESQQTINTLEAAGI